MQDLGLDAFCDDASGAIREATRDVTGDALPATILKRLALKDSARRFLAQAQLSTYFAAVVRDVYHTHPATDVDGAAATARFGEQADGAGSAPGNADGDRTPGLDNESQRATSPAFVRKLVSRSKALQNEMRLVAALVVAQKADSDGGRRVRSLYEGVEWTDATAAVRNMWKSDMQRVVSVAETAFRQAMATAKTKAESRSSADDTKSSSTAATHRDGGDHHGAAQELLHGETKHEVAQAQQRQQQEQPQTEQPGPARRNSVPMRVGVDQSGLVDASLGQSMPVTVAQIYNELRHPLSSVLEGLVASVCDGATDLWTPVARQHRAEVLTETAKAVQQAIELSIGAAQAAPATKATQDSGADYAGDYASPPGSVRRGGPSRSQTSLALALSTKHRAVLSAVSSPSSSGSRKSTGSLFSLGSGVESFRSSGSPFNSEPRKDPLLDDVGFADDPPVTEVNWFADLLCNVTSAGHGQIKWAAERAEPSFTPGDDAAQHFQFDPSSVRFALVAVLSDLRQLHVRAGGAVSKSDFHKYAREGRTSDDKPHMRVLARLGYDDSYYKEMTELLLLQHDYSKSLLPPPVRRRGAVALQNGQLANSLSTHAAHSRKNFLFCRDSADRPAGSHPRDLHQHKVAAASQRLTVKLGELSGRTNLRDLRPGASRLEQLEVNNEWSRSRVRIVAAEATSLDASPSDDDEQERKQHIHVGLSDFSPQEVRHKFAPKALSCVETPLPTAKEIARISSSEWDFMLMAVSTVQLRITLMKACPFVDMKSCRVSFSLELEDVSGGQHNSSATAGASNTESKVLLSTQASPRPYAVPSTKSSQSPCDRAWWFDRTGSLVDGATVLIPVPVRACWFSFCSLRSLDGCLNCGCAFPDSIYHG